MLGACAARRAHRCFVASEIGMSEVSLIARVLFGLFPALHATRLDFNDLLKEGARGSDGRSAARNRAICFREVETKPASLPSVQSVAMNSKLAFGR